MTQYTTGNPERDHMYRNYIAAFGSDIDAIKAAAPNDFEVSADEVAGFILEMESSAAPQPEVTFEDEPLDPVPSDPVTGRAYAAPRKIIEESRLPQPARADESPDSAPQATTGRDMTHAEAVAALRAADLHLTDCRLNVRRTTAALQEARGKLQQEIEKHIANTPQKFTQFDAARAYAATSLEERRQRAARFGTGESATARRFVQKRMTGGGPHRGALNQEQRARVGFVVPGSAAAMAPHDYQADQRARQGLTQPGKPTPEK